MRYEDLGGRWCAQKAGVQPQRRRCFEGIVEVTVSDRASAPCLEEVGKAGVDCERSEIELAMERGCWVGDNGVVKPVS